MHTVIHFRLGDRSPVYRSISPYNTTTLVGLSPNGDDLMSRLINRHVRHSGRLLFCVHKIVAGHGALTLYLAFVCDTSNCRAADYVRSVGFRHVVESAVRQVVMTDVFAASGSYNRKKLRILSRSRRRWRQSAPVAACHYWWS